MTKTRKMVTDSRKQTKTTATNTRTEKLQADMMPLQETLSEATMATASENEGPATNTQWRETGREDSLSTSSSSDFEDAVSGATGHCSPSTKQSRGRPPTTGQYIGLAKAQAELNRLKEAELRRRVEKQAVKPAAGRSQARSFKNPNTPAFEDQLASEINEEIQAQADVALKIAKNSKNLGCIYQTAIEEAAASIKECSELMAGLCDSEDCRKLKAEYTELKAKQATRAVEIDELRKELSLMREELQSLRRSVERETIPFQEVQQTEDSAPLLQPAAESAAPITQGTLDLAIRGAMQEMQAQFISCLEAVARGQSRSSPEMATPVVPEVVAAPTLLPAAAHDNNSPVKKRKTRRAKKSLAVQAVEAARTEPSLPQVTPPENETWATVAKRGPKQRGTKAPAKLAIPRSSAIVLALKSDVANNEVDYMKVVTLAKGRIDIASLDIPYIKYQETATGTRKIEIPGASSGAKADLLAERLRAFFTEAIGEGVVEVSRPVKCAELRISGLDDSITKEEVAATVAAAGSCPIRLVKVGEIRRAPYGIRSIWARCPVEAAKRLTRDRKLMFGWVATQVKLLQPAPLRCFRCLEVGHIKQRCKSTVDRSTLCFRCGVDGHKATECSSAPHCPICASAKKPAEHRLGSRACVAPPRLPPGSAGDTHRRR